MARGRRGNGEGSIYQETGRGWRGEIITAQGKRKRVSGETRAEVVSKLNKLMIQRDQGIVPTPGKLKVGQYLTTWLETVVKVDNSPATYDFYESISRVHLKPTLGNITLEKLSPTDVRSLLAKVKAEGLSDRTVQGVHATIKAALGDALRMELIHRNVATLVQTNLAKEIEHDRQANLQTLDLKGARHFLKAIAGHRFECAFTIGLMVGLRRAEVCALRWSDVNFENRTITVRHAIISVRNKGTRLAPVKGRRVRTLQVPAAVMGALTMQLEQQRQQRKLAGTKWREQEFIFTSANGDNWHPDTLSSEFKEALAKAGLSGYSLHDLRHSCASLLISKGVHAKVVQAQLGHSRFSTTMDLYSHVLPGMQEEAANTMDAMLSVKRSRNRGKLKSPGAISPRTSPGSGAGLLQ